MSSGLSVSGIAVVVDLAWSTLQRAKEVCGEHDELTRATSRLYLALEHLQSEISNAGSMFNRHKGGRRKDLEVHVNGSRTHLRRVCSVLARYRRNERGNERDWGRSQFGTTAVQDLLDCQVKLSTYTIAIMLTLNLLSMGSQGRAEKDLSHQRGEAKRLRASINLLLAKQTAASKVQWPLDGICQPEFQSERQTWRSLKRGLVEEGFKRNVIHANKDLIKAYIQELRARGLLAENTLQVRDTSESSVFVELDVSDDTASSSSYRPPTVEDVDNLSFDTLSIDEPRPLDVPRAVSKLPEHDIGGELAAHIVRGKKISTPGNQNEGPTRIFPNPLQQTYEPYLVQNPSDQQSNMELVGKTPYSQNSNNPRRPLQQMNLNRMNSVTDGTARQDYPQSEQNQMENARYTDEVLSEWPASDTCHCYECRASLLETTDMMIDRPGSYKTQRDSSDRSGSPHSKKQKLSLSLLLFSTKRKAKRAAPTTPDQSPQRASRPRKRQKRAPAPPRPVSPTPPPPQWWLEERLRRRPVGFERGRSPTPRKRGIEVFDDPFYNVAMAVYPEVNYGKWGSYQ